MQLMICGKLYIHRAYVFEICLRVRAVLLLVHLLRFVVIFPIQYLRRLSKITFIFARLAYFFYRILFLSHFASLLT
jgi:hypothetical protein